MDTFIVHNDGVALPVTVGGTGPRALFVPGMSITAAALSELVEELRGFVELATFDLRATGRAAPPTTTGTPRSPPTPRR